MSLNGGVDMAKVSVIVPIYNTEKFLKRCLNSLQCQSLKDIEFILVNDGSTDKSLDMMQNYHDKDPRFKIISLDENQGVSVARNKGIDIATGEYIGFVDSDDYIDNNYYENLSETIEKTKVPISLCANQWDATHKMGLIDYNVPNPDLTIGGPSVCCALFKYELIGNDRFIEQCRFEDTAFTYLMRMKGKEMFITNKTAYHYCRDNENSFNDIGRRSPQNILDLLKVVSFLEQTTNNQEFSMFQSNIAKINLSLQIEILNILPEISSSHEECCDLVSHFDTIIEKSSNDTLRYQCRYVNRPLMWCKEALYTEQYRNLDIEESTQLFKQKIKRINIQKDT